jgi:hypothetical protein
LQAGIIPAFLQGQRRESFKGAQHFLNFHASSALLFNKEKSRNYEVNLMLWQQTIVLNLQSFISMCKVKNKNDE